jgi:hypothetical protein
LRSSSALNTYLDRGTIIKEKQECMDKKIDIETLKAILRDHVEDSLQANILRDINQILNEEAEEKAKEAEEKPPKVAKKTIVILTALPEGLEEKEVSDMVGFITEIAEEDRTGDLKYKINDVMETYKVSRKAQKNPADGLGDLFEVAPTKLFKESGIFKKPRGPVEFTFIKNR